jgi:hypothetical protein
LLPVFTGAAVDAAAMLKSPFNRRSASGAATQISTADERVRHGGIPNSRWRATLIVAALF